MPGLSHLQYEEEAVHCDEKGYSIRRAASAVGKQDVWWRRMSALSGMLQSRC